MALEGTHAMTNLLASTRPRRHRGLSMVELLVGVAIGLVVAAAAAKLLAGHIHESRKLLLEARLMQDLRTTTDLVTRDLRRAGHWGAAASGVWAAGASGVLANPYAALAADTAASDVVTFQFSRDSVENHQIDSNERFGFRLRHGAIDMKLGAAPWQALTDSTTLTITAFSITPTVQNISLAGYCARACTGSSCPQQQVRSLAVRISGRALNDASVARSLHSDVRLRNDTLTGACPT
jgi:prepilin peptidase dependent protein B